ncbi:hypothetical protein Cch01nite_37490 [Cellulomonas chitinilytica]|uniref:Uncharacterized protein n=1 Tax=Cellulomonas chitinilytica TaxID=398759 RepID=A0A919P695_9CELL|nr:hypothetical protein [Cellulomonas chitinilytica]GIG23025.1 hypothetical protein Cch01nite_37490 [Cellulomonas chitinilytica]
MTAPPDRAPSATGLGSEARREARELPGDVADGFLGDAAVVLIGAAAFVVLVGGAGLLGWLVGGATTAVVGALVGFGLFVVAAVVVVVVAGAGLLRRWRATRR